MSNSSTATSSASSPSSTVTPPPYQDRGKGLLAEEISLTFVALFTTVLRVGIRLWNRQARWDDFTITLAMCFRLVSFSFTMLSIAAGNGKHDYYLTEYQIETVMKWTWGNELLIFVVTCIVKIAIILHIFRIKNSGWLKWLLNITIVGLVVTNGACVIILFAQCHPLSYFWTRQNGSCWDQAIYNDFIYVSVGYSIVSDLLCTAMPIVILWNVRITRKQKLAICGLMFLGLIASACAAVRAYLSSLQEGSDLTWALVTTDEWAFAEANVGIIAANLALGQMMYVFFRKRWGPPKSQNSTERADANTTWRSLKSWLRRNRSQTTLVDPSDIKQTKETDSEINTCSEYTNTNTTTTDENTTAPPSRESMWPAGRLSNTPGCITRTIEYTVTGVPHSELYDQEGPPPTDAHPWISHLALAGRIDSFSSRD